MVRRLYTTICMSHSNKMLTWRYIIERVTRNSLIRPSQNLSLLDHCLHHKTQPLGLHCIVYGHTYNSCWVDYNRIWHDYF
jgi:hypothetical protein